MHGLSCSLAWGSSRTRDRTCIPRMGGGFLSTAPPGKSCLKFSRPRFSGRVKCRWKSNFSLNLFFSIVSTLKTPFGTRMMEVLGACVCVSHACLTLCDPMDCSPPGSSVPRAFPGKDPGVGWHSLLQIILTQGLNLGLPHCRLIL